MGKSIRAFIAAGLGVLAAAEAWAQAGPANLTIQKDQALGTKRCDVVTWSDANGRERKVWLVRADGDPGYSGGYIDQYTYYIDNVLKTGRSDGTQPGVAGLGVAVNHHSGASTSKANSSGATTGFVFEGANHCLWRFTTPTYSGEGKNIKLTIDWVLSQGRNDVLWAVSYDTGGQAGISWDARGPYFQFDWDGDGQFYNGTISGIRWGDKYKFRTVAYNAGNPAATTWDYSEANTIPYMTLWKAAGLGDVEAGVVQTQTWTQQDAGGYWWSGSHWGQSGTGMMENWNCPFQLNAYEGYAGEKMAWGTPFGFVGSATYQRVDFATNSVGAPHQGYSTYIVLNKFSQGLTDAMIASMAAVQGTTLTATTGSVVTSGPRHANLTGDANYQPAGWNHVVGAWALNAGAGNVAAFNVNAGGGTLLRPLFVIGNYTAATPPATVTLGGAPLAAGTDYSASVDAAGQKLWLTLHRNLSGATNALSTGAAAAPPGPAPTPTPTPTPSNAAGDDGGSDKKCGCGTAEDAPGFVWTGLGLLALLLAALRS